MSLRSLIESAGSTLGDAARACAVPIALFDRIDAGLQPLPRVVAERLAALLGTNAATVLVEVPSWIDRSDPILLRPVPGVPGRDFLGHSLLVPPAPPVLPRTDETQIFVLSDDFLDAEIVASRVGRDGGEIYASVEAAAIQSPRRAVSFAGRVWAAGGVQNFVPAIPILRVVAAFEPPAMTLDANGGTDLGAPAGLVAEPISGTLWAGRIGPKLVSAINAATAEPDADVSVGPASPVDLAATGGRVYVLTDAEELLELDPSIPAIVDTATFPGGAGASKCCCSSGDGIVFVANGPPTPGVRAVDAATMTVSSVAVSGPLPDDPRAMAASADRIWISDSDSGDLRLVGIDRASGQSVERTFPGLPPGGAPVFDGLYVWIPAGLALKIHPLTLEILLEVPGTENAAAIAVG